MGADLFPPPPPLPPPGATLRTPERWHVAGQYESRRGHLRAARLLSGLSALVAGGFGAAAALALRFDDWSGGDGRRAGEIAVAMGVIAWVCYVASYVALAVWTGRMYRDLCALNVAELRFTPGWGVGAWFVPILNLFRPKQIVDELWRLTDPDAHPSGAWRGAPVSASVHAWWAMLLVAGFVTPRMQAEIIDRAFLWVGLVGAVCLVAFSALSCVVTSALTTRLESCVARRGYLTLGPTDARTLRRTVASTPVLVGGMALLGLGGGAGIVLAAAPATDRTESIAGGSSGEGDSTGPTSVFDLDIGDCFDEPAPTVTTSSAPQEINVVKLVRCDRPHTSEVLDVVEHDAPSGAAYPDEKTLFQYTVERCTAGFETIVGTPFLQSELDMWTIHPTKDSWRLGDRTILCIAIRVDGRPLVDSVVGSGL